MAIKKMYALYDHTTKVFLNPITLQQDGEAVRWFTTIINGDESKELPALYPEQFSLYRLDDFNDTLGKYIPRDGSTDEKDRQPKEITTGLQVKNEVTKYSINDLIKMIQENTNLQGLAAK